MSTAAISTAFLTRAALPRPSLRTCARRKGLNPEEAETFDLDAYKQQQYDILADAVRRGMDMDFVYKVLNRQV